MVEDCENANQALGDLCSALEVTLDADVQSRWHSVLEIALRTYLIGHCCPWAKILLPLARVGLWAF